MPEQKETPRFEAVELYVIALMAAALHERRADAKPADITWEQVWRLVSRHSIASLTFPALPEGALDDMPATVSEGWRRAADMALFQQVGYEVDREAILADFAEAGLSWIPLKGIMVAGYYPQPGMRSMSDQDIVVGYVEPDGHGGWKARGDTAEEQAAWKRKADETMTPIMAAHGYEELSNVGREHSFAKPPLHFEMHRSLVSAVELSTGQTNTAELEYYGNPWDLARPSGEPPCEFRFSREVEYVFHVSHMSKHYRGAGFGLRFLADEYLYCAQFPQVVSSSYVQRQLERLDLTTLEHDVRELSMAIFDIDSHAARNPTGGLNREESVLLQEVMSGGLYGSLEHRVASRLRLRQSHADGGDARISAIRYWWRRAFPPREWLDAYYPEWSRNAFTRFALVFHRAFAGLRRHPQILLEELRLVLRNRRPRR